MYLRFGHPDGSGLLLVDEVSELGVPLALRRHVVQVEGGREHVTPKLLQLLALLQQLLGRQMRFPGFEVELKINNFYHDVKEFWQNSNSQIEQF